MAGGFKDYFWECAAKAPSALRRSMFFVNILAQLVIGGALILGWHLNAFTTPQLFSVAGLIALIEIIVFVPYQLWKSNTAEIKRLNDCVRPKLKWSFDMTEPGYVNQNIDTNLGNERVKLTWYRVLRAAPVALSQYAKVTLNCSTRILR